MRNMARRLSDAITRMIGYARRGRRIVPVVNRSDGRVCVNLGCGLAVAPGWVNVDASLNALVAGWPMPMLRLLHRLSGASQYYSVEEYCRILSENAFIHHDLAHSIPLVDGCADVVYTSHFLEHVFRPDAGKVLRESHRALKPGGLIRVCVPDLAYAISLYAAGKKHEMLEHFFFVEDLASFHARHKYLYDFELLKAALEEAGFSQVTRRSYRSGAAPDADILDRYPEETLFVEAIK